MMKGLKVPPPSILCTLESARAKYWTKGRRLFFERCSPSRVTECVGTARGFFNLRSDIFYPAERSENPRERILFRTHFSRGRFGVVLRSLCIRIFLFLFF